MVVVEITKHLQKGMVVEAAKVYFESPIAQSDNDNVIITIV